MLHIVNKSPANHESLMSCLRSAAGGDLLLIEDAVYAATAAPIYESLQKEALQRFQVYVLKPDLEARGVSGKMVQGMEMVDYGGFVDLVVRNKASQSWL